MSDDIHGTILETAECQPKIDLEAGRRAFVRSLGFGAVGTALVGAATLDAASAQEAAAAAKVKPTDVLTFALNLEYLEAEFYLRAYTGDGLPARDRGNNPGQVSGGKKVPFRQKYVSDYAAEIAMDEQHHVEYLRSALQQAGMTPISRPALNIGTSFTVAARAAGLIGPKQTFDAYANDMNFLLAAFIFEDVGVTAYHGGSRFLVGSPYLQPAAQILAVEGYHAGLIRQILFEEQAYRETQLIANLRQQLGPVTSSLGVGGPNGTAAADTGVQTTNQPAVTLADQFGAAYERTTRDVLNVVYGQKGASKGLFFPAGLNGPIS